MTSRQPTTFAEIKLKIRADPDLRDRYSHFLDELWRYNENMRKISSWDIWYFSDNTDFCLDSAKHYRDEFDLLIAAYKSFQEEKREVRDGFTFNKVRRVFGSLFFYLYAALESFAHETNILYDLKLQRRKVSINRVSIELKKKRCKLDAHMKTFLEKPNVKMFITYRDAIMHGYVYPLSGSKKSLLLKRNPKIEPFSFSDVDQNFEHFVDSSFSEVKEFIRDGWKCFSLDELS